MYNTSLDSNQTMELSSIKHVNDMEVIKFILAIMGVLGNTLAAIVWADDRRKSSSSLFLLCLSLYDLVYLGGVVISLVLYFERFTDLNIPILNVKIANNILSIIYNAALCGSSLSTVAITAERYIAVCKPLKVIVVCSRKRAKMVVSAVGGVCILYAVLYAMYVFMIVIPVLQRVAGSNLSRCVNSEGNISVTTCTPDNYVSWIIKYEYDITLIVGQALLVYIVPWVTILFLNILLLKEMSTSDFGSNFRSAARRQLEKRLVLSVMAVCALSLISHPVGFVGLMLPLFVQGRVSRSSSYLFDTWNILKLVNSGANFVFYSTISAQFRRTLMQKIQCLCCRRVTEPYSYTATNSEPTVTCSQ
ncbi:FMRFamide peptide receptor frpr-18-like [Haliotis cracherodii]|uniref:FMRFamide peptide receptor frpr-18-like n=1 Tax=Haliotis cracherodii TaxID=6455 RepID=UPI0039EC5651